MIVKMKKLSLLLYYQEKEQFLRSLQDAGFVHIIEYEHKETHFLHELDTEIKETDRVLRELVQLGARIGIDGDEKVSTDSMKLVLDFIKLRHEQEGLTAKLKNLERDEQHLMPFDDVDPALLRKLVAAGVFIRFYAADTKEFERLSKICPVLVAAERTKHQVYFIVIGEALPAETSAQEMQLPEHSLKELAAKKEALKKRITEIDARCSSCVCYYDNLMQLLCCKKDEFSFQSAGLDFSSVVEDKVLAMNGFFPAADEAGLRSILQRFTVWCKIEDPALDETVPVQLKNSAFARLFEPITRLYMLPGYREMDPTPILAPFFTLFVGLCLGDVAYGAFMLVLAFIAYRRVSEKAKPYTVMGAVLGAMTILCGFMLNSCFGEPLFGGQDIENAFFSGGARYCMLSPYKTAGGVTEFPAMSFSLLLGFIQILSAMTVQTIVRIRHGGLISGLMPISYIMMLFGMLVWGAHANAFNLHIADFTVGRWYLGRLLLHMPLAGGQFLLLGGMGILLVFNNPGKKLFVRPMLGLWELYNYATGILGDMLSYIRLFALGLCSGLLGNTFNSMALGFITKDTIVQFVSPWVICTILLLVGGHVLNFALSLVGAFVHPLRLTFVEFFKNLGFEWGGKPFLPLCRISSKRNR